MYIKELNKIKFEDKSAYLSFSTKPELLQVENVISNQKKKLCQAKYKSTQIKTKRK